MKQLEPQLAEADEALSTLLAATPNIPHETAPDGFTDEDAVEVRRHLDPTAFDFEPRDHAEIGALLGVLDVDRAVRASGSRFVYLLGDLVFVQFALMRHAMDILVAKGFMPVIPPVLVRRRSCTARGSSRPTATSTGPTPTSCIWSARRRSRSPLCIWARSSTRARCRSGTRATRHFRREAGTGKDMGGMFRVHQFDKVEMFSFSHPSSSWDELEFLVSVEEEIVGNLDLPYRVVNIAAGDLGGAAAKKVRHRSVAARAGALSGDHVLLELHGLRRPPSADQGAHGRWEHRCSAR